MILPFFQVDAFAHRPLTGNPAAVIPLEEWLPDAMLQAIAAENNLSETAFTIPADGIDADFHLRWFTPTTEVGMCGHATLAAGHVLLTGSSVRFATKAAGTLVVRRSGEQLEIALPIWKPTASAAPDVLEALKVDGPAFRATGAEDVVIVLLPDQAAVRAVRPDFAALARIDALVAITAPGDLQDIASRVFAANVGVNEDPVTGAAHAALVPFWAERLGRTRFTACQGGSGDAGEGRGGMLECALDNDRVRLSGRCWTVIEGSFQL